MSIATDNADLIRSLNDEIVRRANGQFDSANFRRFFAVPLNVARAQAYIIQRTHWTVNRRDCWGLVQGIVPMDVKKVIWDHEREELEGRPDAGIEDHYTLSVREGAVLGLTPDDFINTPPCDGLVTCMHAWLHLAKHSHWLTALASSAALELSNSEEILTGGSNSRRWGEKMQRELGIPLKTQAMNAEHMVADVAHGHLLLQVAQRHLNTEADKELIVEGLRQSWTIERVWKGQLADLLSAIAD